MNRTNLEISIAQSSVFPGDPHICSDSTDRNNIVFSVYDTLVKRDDHGNYIPSLAENWVIQNNAKNWKFRLRKDVFFHNGEKLNEKDVIATLQRVVDPSIGGAFGTEGVYTSYLGVSKITSDKENVFEITTNEPMADFLDILVTIPISPESALNHLPKKYVGTGPFKVLKMNKDETILQSFNNYWAGAPNTKKIRWISESDPVKRVEMLSSGEIDIATNIGLEGKNRVNSSKKFRTQELRSGLCIIFMCNAQSGVCKDKRVRRALNFAIDIDDIISRVKGGAATPLNGYLTPHHFGYDPETPFYSYDPEIAKKLLSDAGYKDGMELTLDIPLRMPDEAPMLGKILTEYYEQVGIKVEVKTYQDREAYALMVKDKKINDACCFDSSPLSTFRVLKEKIHSGIKGPWWQGYTNRNVDMFIDKAQSTIDSKERQKIYRMIYKIIHEDAPWIFLYRPTVFWGTNLKMKKWKPDSEGLLQLF